MRNDDGRSPAGERWEDTGFTLHGDSWRLRTSDDRDILNNIFSEEKSLCNNEEVTSTEQPDVSDGYWEQIEKTITRTSSNGVRKRSDLPIEAITLDSLTPLALAAFKEILEAPLDLEDPNYSRLIATKNGAAVAVVNAVIKSDENSFKKRNNTVLENLLLRMKQAEKPVITIEQN